MKHFFPCAYQLFILRLQFLKNINVIIGCKTIKKYETNKNERMDVLFYINHTHLENATFINFVYLFYFNR